MRLSVRLQTRAPADHKHIQDPALKAPTLKAPKNVTLQESLQAEVPNPRRNALRRSVNTVGGGFMQKRGTENRG